MLSKLVAKFANHISDAKVHNTILAFREHVPTPTMNDLAQLDDVLSAYVKRLVQKDESKRRLMAKTLSAANLSARVESQIKEQGSGPVASPGELMEKLRAESAKEELMDNYRATVAKEAEKENEEVMKIRALIVRDKAEAEAKKAAGAAAAQAVKELNAAEEARKKVAQRLQRDKDEREMKKYQEMLEARQRAREEEEEARLARLAAQAAVAQQRFDQAETDAEADERRAKEVQRQRQARQDAAAAAMVAQKKKEQKATMAYVQMQQRAHVEQDALVLQANRREAALNKIEFEKALKRDDERRNAVRAKNLAYGKSIQRQVAEDQSYLASGAGERGMTKFEKQYNRDAISNVRRFAQRHYRFHSQGPETKSDAVLCRSLRKKRALEDQKMAVSQPE